MISSVFTTVAATHTAEGQVSEAELADTLETMFKNSQESIKEVGKLAVRTPNMNYANLPWSDGLNLTSNPHQDPIASFFGSGKFLYTGSTFGDILTATFALFKKKLVDHSLQSGGFQVVAELNIPDADTCGTYYGAQWLDVQGGLCFRMFQHAETAQGCAGNDGQLATDEVGMMPTSCNWVAIENSKYDLLQDKYDYNMYDYYMDAYDCAMVEGGTQDSNVVSCDATLNLLLMLTSCLKSAGAFDGSAPKCFFNPPTVKGCFGSLASGREGSVYTQVFNSANMNETSITPSSCSTFGRIG